ncbi:MAG TPA: DUF6152 family protein [Vicinamibacterales bacterium]|nr:DUF6152 family protein [Vicinamibacterales bacterium]
MGINRRGVFIGALLLASGISISAHHSFAAEFDANQPVQLKGTVVKVEWINPHTWIHLDVKKSDGSMERWMIEGGTPNTLLRRGLTKNSLPEGTELVVDGYKAKNGSNRANGRDLTFTDGRKLFMGSSGTGAPRDGKDTTEK